MTAKPNPKSHKNSSRRQEPSPAQSNDNRAPRGEQRSEILPLFPKELARGAQDMQSLLMWPLHVFESIMAPWARLTPFGSWMGNMTSGNDTLFPGVHSEETDKEYVYTLQLPGVSPENAQLTITNGALVLSAESARESREKGGYQSFSHSIRQSFPLPAFANAQAISAVLKDDRLVITVPKAERAVASSSGVVKIKSSESSNQKEAV